jgi:hypothetical protein
MSAVVEDCAKGPDRETMSQPALHKMASTTSLEGVVSSTQSVTVSAYDCRTL